MSVNMHEFLYRTDLFECQCLHVSTIALTVSWSAQQVLIATERFAKRRSFCKLWTFRPSRTGRCSAEHVTSDRRDVWTLWRWWRTCAHTRTGPLNGRHLSKRQRGAIAEEWRREKSYFEVSSLWRGDADDRTAVVTPSLSNTLGPNCDLCTGIVARNESEQSSADFEFWPIKYSTFHLAHCTI